MTSESRPTPDETPDDVFGDPLRSLAVPDPAWMPEISDDQDAVEVAPRYVRSLSTEEAPRVPADATGDGLEISERWSTAPAMFAEATGPVPDEQFSHRGLGDIDPWERHDPWHHAVWPWGWGGVVETLDVLILALVMFMGVRFMAHNYIVDGASMSPTFEDSDFLIVNRMAYRTFDFSWIPGVEMDAWRPFGAPEPGDVIVFHFQPATSDRDFIKRVIAVPGQTVHVTGGVVYVDDVRLNEPYIAQPPNYEFPATLVKPGTVFVLGDNRNNSYDSHAFGPVEQSTIVGRADFRYWPTTRWGLVDHVIGDGQQLMTRAVGGIASLWP
ncbi:MAG: signal peptidase I [Chloroflexi bacterium]|nr:signal peptidase I [Chloroflexota bacterium]